MVPQTDHWKLYYQEHSNILLVCFIFLPYLLTFFLCQTSSIAHLCVLKGRTEAILTYTWILLMSTVFVLQ